MGNKGSHSLDDITLRLEARVGRLPVSGRYHRLPRRIEDDYEVAQKVLGSGYNGVVRLATSKAQTNSSQRYAIKAFKLSNVANDKRAQLESEVEIFLAMDHPHITRLFDVYESEDYLHLVMECMEGGELFDRVSELKRFSERDAADAVFQMLLALNYIHSHDIVHRDIKLENFLYEKKGSNQLKLIDFGFSKIWDPNIRMHVSCGTLSYVAPEVLKKSYTSQCDMWSLGVIVFILLAGYMPFSGSEGQQTQRITEGKYTMKPERWSSISKPAKDFTQELLQVDPELRLTAESALQHRFIADRHKVNPEVDEGIVDALRQFGHASRFRRACLEMMAWSLTSDERAKVQQYFLAMDQNRHGTITLGELHTILHDKFHIPDDETRLIFHNLSSMHDEEIHYSDFLAAMVSTRIAMHDDLLRSTFKRFDLNNTGYITVDDLRKVLGDTFDGEKVESLIGEVDHLQDGKLSYAEFVEYLRGNADQRHHEATLQVIDTQLKDPKKRQSFMRGAGAAVLISLRRPSTAASSPVSPGLSEKTGSTKTPGSDCEKVRSRSFALPPNCCSVM